MSEVGHSIDLNLSTKLQDREYRRKFFLAESSAWIASQIIALRKRRGLSQKELADITGTRQPAISRAEQADYQNWSFNTLRRISDALDARIRVLIEPAEDVVHEYEEIRHVASVASAEPVIVRRGAMPATLLALGAEHNSILSKGTGVADQVTGDRLQDVALGGSHAINRS